MMSQSKFSHGLSFTALLVFCMTSAHGMHRHGRDPISPANAPVEKARSRPPLPPRSSSSASSSSRSHRDVSGASFTKASASRVHPASSSASSSIPAYTSKPRPIITKEELVEMLAEEGRQVKAELLTLMAAAERKRNRAASEASAISTSASTSASRPTAARAPEVQTPDFTHLRRRKEMCRAAYSIMYFLDQEHTYTLSHTQRIIEGAPFGESWSFSRSQNALITAFSELPSVLQNRFMLIWANAEEDLAVAGGTLPDVFPLQGRAQAPYYNVLLEAFERVGLKNAAAALIPRDLPEDPREVTLLNKSLERLYRYGLTPDERGRVIRKFHRGIARLQKK